MKQSVHSFDNYTKLVVERYMDFVCFCWTASPIKLSLWLTNSSTLMWIEILKHCLTLENLHGRPCNIALIHRDWFKMCKSVSMRLLGILHDTVVLTLHNSINSRPSNFVCHAYEYQDMINRNVSTWRIQGSHSRVAGPRGSLNWQLRWTGPEFFPVANLIAVSIVVK